MAVSADAPAMRQGAKAFSDTKALIDKSLAFVDTEVQGMPYEGQASNTFRSVIGEWKAKAQQITNDLDNMAQRLNHSATLQEKTDQDNQGSATSARS